MDSSRVTVEGEVTIDVQRLGGRRPRWTARRAGAELLVWEVEADDPIENERVGWRSTSAMDRVEESSAESFPGSAPPSWTPGRE
jgi:hypothetical protein